MSFPEAQMAWLALSGFLCCLSHHGTLHLGCSCPQGGGRGRSTSLEFLAPGRLPSSPGNRLLRIFAAKGALWWHGRPIALLRVCGLLVFLCFVIDFLARSKRAVESGILAALLRNVCRSLVHIVTIRLLKCLLFAKRFGIPFLSGESSAVSDGLERNRWRAT